MRNSCVFQIFSLPLRAKQCANQFIEATYNGVFWFDIG